MGTLDRYGAEWFVQPGDVVFDIGTCVGQTAARYVERGAMVHGFEPLERNRAGIPVALRQHPGFCLHPFALADRPGRLDLIVPRRNSGAASLSRTFFERTRNDDADQGEVHAVEVRRLDDLGLPRARFWKIDVEGSERAVLNGAVETLRTAAPEVIQVEVFKHDEGVYRATLDHLKSLFPYVWAIGVRARATFVHYEITPKTIASPLFHKELWQAGTPTYYASSRPFWEWWDAYKARKSEDIARVVAG